MPHRPALLISFLHCSVINHGWPMHPPKSGSLFQATLPSGKHRHLPTGRSPLQAAGCRPGRLDGGTSFRPGEGRQRRKLVCLGLEAPQAVQTAASLPLLLQASPPLKAAPVDMTPH